MAKQLLSLEFHSAVAQKQPRFHGLRLKGLRKNLIFRSHLAIRFKIGSLSSDLFITEAKTTISCSLYARLRKSRIWKEKKKKKKIENLLSKCCTFIFTNNSEITRCSLFFWSKNFEKPFSSVDSIRNGRRRNPKDK